MNGNKDSAQSLSVIKDIMAAGADSVAIIAAGLEREIQDEAQQIAVQFEEQINFPRPYGRGIKASEESDGKFWKNWRRKYNP